MIMTLVWNSFHTDGQSAVSDKIIANEGESEF